MCSKRSCSNCGKASWVGCGLHVESALAGVGVEDRCPNWKQGANRPCQTNEDGTYSVPTESGTKGFMQLFGFNKK